MLVKKFIQDIVEEKNGFSFDQPHRLGETILSVVVPIVRNVDEERDYITLAEARDVKIEDTGQIGFVYVKNNEDKPLYVSRGEIFRGKTQERAAIHGYIIEPGKGARVAVRCIHATKGINSGTTMEYGGKVPYDINLSSQTGTWNSVSTYASNFNGMPFEQAKMSGSFSDITGSNITKLNSRFTDGNSFTLTGTNDVLTIDCCLHADNGSVLNYPANSTFNMASSDDLVGTLDNMSDNIRDAMKKIPSVANQVGIAFIKENKITGLDVYNIPVSWEKIKDDVIEKEGSAFIDDSDDIFTFNPDKAALLLKKCLGRDFVEKAIYDQEYRVVEIRYEDLIGEVVIYKQKVIHLTMWNTGKK